MSAGRAEDHQTQLDPADPPTGAADSMSATVRSAPEPVLAVGGGRYRIVRFLGRGAMKEVFLAQDTRLDRPVALAIVHRAVASPGLRRALEEEARTMAALGDHPHIVTVHDVGEDEGRTFIVCQYVPGGPLSARLERSAGRRLPVADALALAQDVADALAHAHERGIVHRDVKPGNVLLTDRGSALLGDFGLATAASRAARHDHGRPLVGTVPYMAPGQGPEPDPRNDLYSFGATLYELLCGAPPFVAPDAASVLRMHRCAARPSPAASNPDVPAALDRLVVALLAVDPAERPASAEEVREALAAVAARGRAGRDRGPVPLPPGLPPTAGRSPFVGRREALATLLAAGEDSLADRARVVFVRGEAGIGKTRICAEVAAALHARGATVLYGRCEEQPLAPYQPFREALGHFARHRPRLPDLVQLPPGVRLERLGWPVEGRGPGLDGDGARAGRYEHFAGAVALVQAMAGLSPLVVIFDDIQWADAGTLRMLRHLIRHVSRAPVLLLCTVREGEPPAGRGDHEITPALLQAEAGVETVLLGGLSEAETAELVGSRGGPAEDELRRRLWDRTGGNPLYLRELLRLEESQLRADLAGVAPARALVPEAIARLLDRRLRRLDPATRELLHVAAILGPEFGLTTLGEVAGQPLGAVMDAVEEAMAHGILAESGAGADHYAFCHAILRVALYRAQRASRRWELHERCARVLIARHGDDPAHAAEIAHHCFEARLHMGAEEALRYSEAAARYAAGSLAYEDAALHARRARQVLAEEGRGDGPHGVDLLLMTGRALWRASDGGGARAAFAEAAELALRLGDAERLARAALGLGHRIYDPGALDRPLIEWLRRALDALPAEQVAWRARVLARLAEALQFHEAPDSVRKLAREALDLARASGDPQAIVLALEGLHAALLDTAFLPERLALNAELLERLRRTGPPDEHRAQAMHWRLYDLFEDGQVDAARAEHEELVEIARYLQQPLYLHFAVAWEAKWRETAGEFAAAEELARRSREYALRAGVPYAQSNYDGQLFGLRRDQGRLRGLSVQVRRDLGAAAAVPVWRAGLVLAALDEDDPDEARRARAEFEALTRDDAAAVPRDLLWLGAMCLLAEACGRLHDRDRAAMLLRKLAPFEARNAQIGLAVSVGTVRRFLGILAATLERWEEAEEHFEIALRRSAALGAATSATHIRLEYAEMLLARDAPGDRPRAAALLAEGRAEAERLNVEPVAQRARALQER